jgi:hypothetical protein
MVASKVKKKKTPKHGSRLAHDFVSCKTNSVLQLSLLFYAELVLLQRQMLNPIPLHKRHMVGSKIKKDTKTWFKTSS